MRLAAFMAAIAIAAGASSAKDVPVLLEKMGPVAKTVPEGVPGFGYVADPRPGGEEATLGCRQAGAWALMTSRCDEDTLRFLGKSDVRIVLRLKGSATEIGSVLKRIADGKHERAVAAYQLGERPASDDDLEKWRAVAEMIVKTFPKAPIVLPANDANPPLAKALGASMRSVSHMAVDVSGKADPAAELRKISTDLAASADENLRRLKIWAIAPSGGQRLPKPAGGAFAPAVWKVRWLMSALSVEKVDAVFFSQPYAADGFGAALRHLGVAFRGHASVLSHGVDGDVEYLVLLNGRKDRLCLMMANSGDVPATVTVDMKFNRNDTGTRRWVAQDAESGKAVRGAIGMYARPKAPFSLSLAPFCVETLTLNVWK